jgi:hypothetical protein
MNLACSPQVKTRLRLPCFYGRTLSRTVPAICAGRPCQEMAQIHMATKSQASAWNPTNSCQITKFLTRHTSVLSLSRKFVNNHRCCPIPAAILVASQLEAVLYFCRSSLRLDPWGRGVGGGGLSLVLLILINTATGR